MAEKEKKLMEDEIKILKASELVKMFKDAILIYGDRPVFVKINGHNYLINDMEFAVNGDRYTLYLK